MATEKHLQADRDAYSHVGYTLLVGLLVSIAVMVVGLIAVALAGSGGSAHVYPLDEVIPNLLKGKAPAILDTGILLLFATPLVGVLVALIEWIRQEDRAFILVTGGLVILLALSIVIALH